MTDLEREEIGKAFGYALAVYDQTTGRAGDLGRVSTTMNALADMAAEAAPHEGAADVLSGISAGLMAYMQVAMAKKSGLS